VSITNYYIRNTRCKIVVNVSYDRWW